MIPYLEYMCSTGCSIRCELRYVFSWGLFFKPVLAQGAMAALMSSVALFALDTARIKYLSLKANFSLQLVTRKNLSWHQEESLFF
jgi:hypothetical protein